MNPKILPLLALCVALPVLAKLPPLDDAAKAKAAEAAAKTAWQGKVDAFQLCKSQDRVVAHVNKTSKAKPAASTCADPGPFVYPLPDAASAAAATPAAPAAKPGAAAAPAKKS